MQLPRLVPGKLKTPRRNTRVLNVCVVDPQRSDYADWQEALNARGGQFHHVASAEEALRLARRESIDLWVVNTELPGLSGCELCGMLRAAGQNAPVYLATENYSPALEQTAWQVRATLFGCKPAHHQWLDHWLKQPQTSRRAVNAARQPALRT